MKTTQKRPSLLTPAFLSITVANLAYFVSVGILLPVLPLYVTGSLGGGPVSVGLAIGSFTGTALLLRPFVGGMGDRHGRRVLMIGGSVIVFASLAGLLAAKSLAVLVLFRLLNGAGEAFFFVGAMSAINDLAPDERRGEAVSLFSISLYGGLAAGPILGEALLGDGRYEMVWLVAAAAAAAALLVALRVPDTRSPRQTTAVPGRRRIVHPAAIVPGLGLLALVWGFAGFNAFMPLYARELGMSGSRLVFVVYSIVMIGIRSAGARIPDALGARRAAPLALGIAAVGLGIVGVSGTIAGLYAGTVVFATGQALAFPALNMIAVGGAPAHERGAVVGTFTAFFDIAFGVGAISLGAVAAAFDYRGTFLVAALVAAVGAAGMRAALGPAKTAPPGTPTPAVPPSPEPEAQPV